MTCAALGHPGGSFSESEFLAVLFQYALRFDPSDPRWPMRDVFYLSKCHACPALCSVLALYGWTGPSNLRDAIVAVEREAPALMRGGADPGLAVAVVWGAKLAWTRGSAVKIAETGEPVTDASVFEAAPWSAPAAPACGSSPSSQTRVCSTASCAIGRTAVAGWGSFRIP
jgi:hypothetical protein